MLGALLALEISACGGESLPDSSGLADALLLNTCAAWLEALDRCRDYWLPGWLDCADTLGPPPNDVAWRTAAALDAWDDAIASSETSAEDLRELWTAVTRSRYECVTTDDAP